MKSLVIYDSNYGNTKLIAETVAYELGTDAKAVKVDDVAPDMLSDLSLLVVGSPINGWRPTPKILSFLGDFKPGQLSHVKVAAFDTRIKLFIHGNAIHAITKLLITAGGVPAAEPQGFTVMGKEGPLVAGELERAKKWAQSMRTAR